MNERLKALEGALTKDDWQYIHGAVEDRFKRASSRPGEPKNSKEFEDQKFRIGRYLMARAYG